MSNWQSAPIRRLFRIVNGGTPSGDQDNWDGDIPWATPIDLGKVDGGVLRSTERTLTLTGLRTGSRTVSAGSIVVSTRAPIGYVAQVEASTAFNQGCRGLEPATAMDIRFFRYQMSAASGQIAALGQGSTFVELATEQLAGFPVAAPPLEVQRTTADYLDRETARIDALIAAKQRTASLLAERWRSQRSHAILQGCDPVTGAGVPPAGCDVRNLGATVTLQRGHDLPSDSRIPGDVPVVSSGGVSGSHNRAACPPPGVVTGRYGTIGSTYYVNTPYWPLNTTLFVSDFRGNWPRWVFHMLAALPLSIDEEKSAVTGINRNVVGALRVPVPPVAEQRRLADLLDAASDAKDAMATRVDAQIDLLRERRQALIMAAVTGQIEVPVAT